MSNEVTVTIRGHVGERPQLRTGSSTPFVRVSVATTPRIRQAEEWVDGPTQWYQVKAWADFAENIAESLDRGDAVIVVGPLRIEEYTSEDGIRYKTAVIRARSLGLDLRRARARATKVRPVTDAHEAGTSELGRSPTGDEGSNGADTPAADPSDGEANGAAQGDVSGPERRNVADLWADAAAASTDAVGAPGGK